MIRPDCETTHLLTVVTFSQWDEISTWLEKKNKWRAIGVKSKRKIKGEKKNMGDLLSQYSTFVACLWLPSFSYRSTHSTSGWWSLLALIGYRGYYVRGSPIKSRKYQTCLILFWNLAGSNVIRSSKIIIMTPHKWRLFWTKSWLWEASNWATSPRSLGVANRAQNQA